MIDLTGKVVLLTGGARGIGAVTARVLHQAGAMVIIHYGHSEQRAEQLAAELGAARAYPVQADLAQPGVAAELWRQAVAWQGHVDVLVNNAAVMPPAKVEAEYAAWSAGWQQTLQVNLVAVADLCREAILHYQSRGGGSIINISSRAAFRGEAPDFMPYAASKAGMIALTRTIARQFAADKVLAYAIAPGFVSRGMGDESRLSAAQVAEIIEQIPLGEMAPPEDVAHTVAFLAAGLAPHMTGATLDINGASYVR